MTPVRILVALFAAVSLQCGAAPFSVRVGSDRVVIDVPPGFADTTDLASPRLQDLAESLTPASNRILLFALTDGDLRRFMVGDQLETKRYAILGTPKTMERDRVSAQAFAAFTADSLRELGKPATEKDTLKLLDEQPRGNVILLSELRKESEVVSILQGTRLPEVSRMGFLSGEKAQYLFSTTTLLLLRGKILRLDIYTGLDSTADVEWLKSVTERCISDLRRLNQ